MKNLTKIISPYLVLILFFSCTKIRTLNLGIHKFDQVPDKIVWFQVAGLSHEHLALIKMRFADMSNLTSFEESMCVGSMWSFNLYELRPQSEKSFLSQEAGSKNIVGNCDDYEKKTLRDEFRERGYNIGILETDNMKGKSLLESLKCNEEYLKGDTFWKMAPANDLANIGFHHLDKSFFDKGKRYFDKSCSEGNCFSSITSNINSLWKRNFSQAGKHLFIIRNFSFEKALEEKNISKAHEILKEIEIAYSEFVSKAKKDNNLLVVITSAASRNIELPKMGQKWLGYVRSGKNIIYRKQSLLSPVFSYGPLAENFCGVFEEDQVKKRFLWVPKS